MKFLALLFILIIAAPLMAYPIVGSFDITYAEYLLLPLPLAITFISEYCDSKNVTLDDVNMTDINRFIRDYADKNGRDILMPEILDKMIEIYGKPSLRRAVS